MKGLIRKDMYMMKTYFRVSWVVILIFLLVGALNENASFYHAYSCMMGGIVPISILSYDEKERWMDYADTLPLSPKTIVRSKYLFGLIFSLGVTVLATVSYAVNCVKNRGGDLSPVPGTAAVFLLLSLLPAILLMPVLFKFGVERGRILYYIMFGGMFGVAAFSGMTGKLSVTGFHPHPLLMMLIAAVLWVASMLLSQVLYPKRYR